MLFLHNSGLKSILNPLLVPDTLTSLLCPDSPCFSCRAPTPTSSLRPTAILPEFPRFPCRLPFLFLTLRLLPSAPLPQLSLWAWAQPKQHDGCVAQQLPVTVVVRVRWGNRAPSEEGKILSLLLGLHSDQFGWGWFMSPGVRTRPSSSPSKPPQWCHHYSCAFCKMFCFHGVRASV